MKPTITNFTPRGGTADSKISIIGSNFLGVTNVQFGLENAIFFIKSDTLIEAYNINAGRNVITLTNADGKVYLDGYTFVKTKIQLPDLPNIGRAVNPDDLVYVWDKIRAQLFNATVSQLPAGSGSGGGGGTIPVYTALGSPFKVRVGDDAYTYDDTNDQVIITDPRLIGKSDYVVTATDRQGEFENWTGATTDQGNLEYDDAGGRLIIHHYQLDDDKHITIYADGVTTTPIQDYIAAQKLEIDKLKTYTLPFSQHGGIVAWFKPAIEIPAPWQEWVPGRGRFLIGQDPTDIYNAENNPDGLSQDNGTAVGNLNGFSLTEKNIPKHFFFIFSGSASNGNINENLDNGQYKGKVAWSSNKRNGNQDYDLKKASDDNAALGATNTYGQDVPDKIIMDLQPSRIVNYIYLPEA